MFMILSTYKSLAGNIDLITNSTNALTISKNEVRQLFLLKKKRLSDGSLIVLVQMNQNNPIHRKFIRDILNISFEDYNRIVNNNNNSGNSGYVITVNTQQEMLDKVTDISNSIGYIDNDYLLINSLNNNLAIYKIIE